MSFNKNRWVITIILLIAIAAIATTFLSGFIPRGNASETNHSGGDHQLYTCGMHPEVIQEGPGNCPICGMKLTPIKNSNAESVSKPTSGERKIKYWRAPMDPTYIRDKPGKSPMGMDLVPVYEDEITEGAVSINPVVMQNMGVRMELVRLGKLVRDLRAVGTFDYDEEKLYTITTKISGYAEELFVNTTGEFIRKGEPLLEIYSPELVNSQKEYLLAYQNYLKFQNNPNENIRKGAESLLDASLKRLEYWDISEKQVEQLRKSGKISKTMVIYSPAEGIVVEKNIEEGQSVSSRKVLFRIADLSEVWLYAHIYEYQLPYVKLGDMVKVNLPYYPGKLFKGVVEFIYPYLNKKTRDVKVRIKLHNSDLKFKPGMYAEVIIKSELSNKRLIIPEEAVLRTGKRELVFVEVKPGVFSPREIITGVSGEGGVIEVKSGLLEGEMVVTSGQFMLDSETKAQEAIKKMIQYKTKSNTAKTAAVAEKPSEDKIVKNLNLTPNKKARSLEDVYTCPMDKHSYILQVGEGNCPDCGMKLVPASKTGRTVYTCPMEQHHNILSDKPGKCPECGMELVPLKSSSNNKTM